MKKITLFVVTVFLFSFLASCSSQNASEDSVTEASTEEIITEESSSESKLDHAVRLFDEFEEEYPELQSYKFNANPLLWKEGDKIKTYATYKKNYDMNDSHYIIFEADGPEGKNKFHVNASKIYMETHMVEGNQVIVYGYASNYHAKYVDHERLPELELTKIYVDK